MYLSRMLASMSLKVSRFEVLHVQLDFTCAWTAWITTLDCTSVFSSLVFLYSKRKAKTCLHEQRWEIIYWSMPNTTEKKGFSLSHQPIIANSSFEKGDSISPFWLSFHFYFNVYWCCTYIMPVYHVHACPFWVDEQVVGIEPGSSRQIADE